MFFKALSLCALALSGVACAAAQGISPGRYTISSSLASKSGQNALLVGPGDNLIVPNKPFGRIPIPVPVGRNQWDLTPGQSGGFIMQNVAFGSFLKVDSNNPGTPVTSGTQDQATSFAVTSAGSGQFHVNVVAQDRLWALPPPQAGPLPIGTDTDSVSTQPANVNTGTVCSQLRFLIVSALFVPPRVYSPHFCYWHHAGKMNESLNKLWSKNARIWTKILLFSMGLKNAKIGRSLIADSALITARLRQGGILLIRRYVTDPTARSIGQSRRRVTAHFHKLPQLLELPATHGQPPNIHSFSSTPSSELNLDSVIRTSLDDIHHARPLLRFPKRLKNKAILLMQEPRLVECILKGT
ncbi:hypothetical protein BD779DRAFT_1474170 [Infundibulicybe gibba]|nr:hypothetical protein BD779DRAFT_1474170 [Infundibulicybe gibba]